MKKIGILICISFFFSKIVFAQEQNGRFDLAFGLGITEAMHFGAKFQASKRSQIGLFYGYWKYTLDDYSSHAFNLDHQYHFGRLSDLSNRSVWFFRQGLSLIINSPKQSNTNDLTLNLSLGREFNFSQKVGLCFDIGLFYQLIEGQKIASPDNFLSDIGFYPLARIQVFYSL